MVLLHNRLNNIPVQDCVILFQRNSCLINDLYEVENMPKITFLNTPGHGKWCENLFLFDKSMIIPPYHLLLAFIDQHTTCFEYLFLILLKPKKNMCL